jgi:prevent-host-death family protein
MTEIGIRALKQNASAVVSRAAAGETITVTDRGRAVAQLGPLPASTLASMVEAGQARSAIHDLRQLPPPEPIAAGSDTSPTLSEVLKAGRDDERY